MKILMVLPRTSVTPAVRRASGGARHHFFMGWRSGPFFFDTQGFLNNQQFTGNDVFDERTCATSYWKCLTLT